MLLIALLSRLKLNNNVRTICTTSKYFIQTTPILCAEPLKKKKKMDPAIIRQREDRRRKKIEKQIRRLERNARQLKPIDELEIPLTLIDEREKRLRKNISVAPEVKEQRASLLNQWANYRLERKLQDYQCIDNLLFAQEKALQELRYESEELYQAAIQIDTKLMPFTATGPVQTPAIDNYDSPDGEYIDITKKWEN